MTIDRKAQRPAAPDRDANPIVPWLHGLAAMGDERWHEAIPALQRFIEMVGKSENRVVAYRNLSACYLALERFDEALAALDEVRRLGVEDADDRPRPGDHRRVRRPPARGHCDGRGSDAPLAAAGQAAPGS